MKRLAIAGMAALMGAGLAAADEVWTTDEGEVIYEADIEDNDMAVLKAGDMRMYVAGLAGVYENRGTYQGIWMMDEAPEGAIGCPIKIVRPGSEAGETSAFWGQLEVTFIDADYPSVWIADFGQCFEPMTDKIIARPVTASGDSE